MNVPATLARINLQAQRRAASAAVARLAGLVRGLTLGALLANPVAGQQLGDFGRVQHGFINDDLMPTIDYLGKVLTNQPHSTFNLTDEEVEMHDRVWRFLVAPHARDWAFQYGWEINKARTGSPASRHLDSYFHWLQGTKFASSRARYNAVSEHIAWDLGTLPKVFHIICVVLDIDRQRGVAADGIDDIEPAMVKEQRGRAAENEAYVAHFVTALAYRYDSYDYALSRLLVETPHNEAIGVDDAINRMAPWIDKAESRDFCAEGWQSDLRAEGAIHARVQMSPPSEGEFRK